MNCHLSKGYSIWKNKGGSRQKINYGGGGALEIDKLLGEEGQPGNLITEGGGGLDLFSLLPKY